MNISESPAYEEAQIFLEDLEEITKSRHDALVIMMTVVIDGVIDEFGTLECVDYLAALMRSVVVKGPQREFQGRLCN